MNRRGLLAGVAVLGLLVTVGAGVVLAGVGTGTAGFGSVLGDESHPPALLSFESAGAHCTDDFMANSSTTVAVDGANTQITYARNVSLPGPSYALGGPTFERVNDSTYVLSVPIEETDKAPRDCPGVARYEAAMRIPAGDDPWNVIVEHDGERVTTIHGDSDSSGVGGSASVGQSASDEPAANATEPAE